MVAPLLSVSVRKANTWLKLITLCIKFQLRIHKKNVQNPGKNIDINALFSGFYVGNFIPKFALFPINY